MFDIFLQHSLLLVLTASILPLCFSSFFSLCVAVVQAATQVQEQSIGFLIKFISICIFVLLGGSWFANQFISLFREFLLALPRMGNMP